MQYVYKYVNRCGDVIYVGITNDLPRRIQQHKNDKLQHEDDADIYYFGVNERADAEMLETYLISHYKTAKYYNVSKTAKGDVSFLGDIVTSLPWEQYTGRVNKNINPFIVIPKTEIVEKERVVVEKVPESKITADDCAHIGCEIISILDERIEYENKIIAQLKELEIKNPKCKQISVGIKLHEIVLSNTTEYKNAFPGIMTPAGTMKMLYKKMVESVERLNNFEEALEKGVEDETG